MARVAAVIALASCLAPYSATAQEQPQTQPADPLPDVRALKAGLRKNLLSALMPEMKAHRDALLALEQKQAAMLDFAGAAKARDERARLEKQIAALEQEAAILAARPALDQAARQAARIELKLSEAKLASLQLDAEAGAITGWGSENASATWQLPGLPPGGYEVLLRCTGPVGEVVAKEGFYTLTAPCKSAEDKSIEHNLGTLRIRGGSGSLTLGALQPEKSTGWRVYSVVLVPSGT